MVAGAMDEHHARLLNLLSFARLKCLAAIFATS
jgi:predicted DNA-binding ribbon-helix-helix protein